MGIPVGNTPTLLAKYDLSMDEAAKLLRISRSTIMRWRRQGYGPKPIQYGKVWLYSTEEINRWMDKLIAGSYGN
jgi:excisionase family DNA binding protein